MRRVRLDALLVERGLARSLDEAVEAVLQGRVLVNGALAEKPARQVAPSEALFITPDGPEFVSRGGQKLARALDVFPVDPTGRTAVDAGSATGGFTDCLLQAGAVRVIAVDVGYGQLHERLRQDERVVSLERTNIRDLDRERVCHLSGEDPPPSIVTADLSFTSIRPICARLLEMSGHDGDTILLCKPQFEVDRQVASRGRGVVRDRTDRQEAMFGLCEELEAQHATICGISASPILGPAGNAEFLFHARSDAPQVGATIEEMISAALDEAERLS
jgi:23S rRNA (cytidine1920-2'-O)/16S rRNA (cytidine1409-2'-O)-methyltransferase